MLHKHGLKYHHHFRLRFFPKIKKTLNQGLQQQKEENIEIQWFSVTLERLKLAVIINDFFRNCQEEFALIEILGSLTIPNLWRTRTFFLYFSSVEPFCMAGVEPSCISFFLYCIFVRSLFNFTVFVRVFQNHSVKGQVTVLISLKTH